MDLVGLMVISATPNKIVVSEIGGASYSLTIPPEARILYVTPYNAVRVSGELLNNLATGLVVEQYEEGKYIVLGGPTATHKIIVEFVPSKKLPTINVAEQGKKDESIYASVGDMTYAPSANWQKEMLNRANNIIEQERKKKYKNTSI